MLAGKLDLLHAMRLLEGVFDAARVHRVSARSLLPKAPQVAVDHRLIAGLVSGLGRELHEVPLTSVKVIRRIVSLLV